MSLQKPWAIMFNSAEAEQKNFWGKIGQRRQADHPVVLAFAEPKVDFVRRCIERDQGKGEIKQILDVGCGNGSFTRPPAAWADCTALDFSQRMLDLNPVKAVRVCDDVSSMPFPDNKFDLMFCSNLLHHVSDRLTVWTGSFGWLFMTLWCLAYPTKVFVWNVWRRNNK